MIHLRFKGQIRNRSSVEFHSSKNIVEMKINRSEGASELGDNELTGVLLVFGKTRQTAISRVLSERKLN